VQHTLWRVAVVSGNIMYANNSIVTISIKRTPGTECRSRKVSNSRDANKNMDASSSSRGIRTAGKPAGHKQQQRLQGSRQAAGMPTTGQGSKGSYSSDSRMRKFTKKFFKKCGILAHSRYQTKPSNRICATGTADNHKFYNMFMLCSPLGSHGMTD
jgi:hypothetical protein